MAGEEAYLDKAIGRYAPEVATTAWAALKKLRARFPGARLLVYDRRQSLPIGFAPAGQGSAVFSLVLYPRWVRFFFLEGVMLEDPERRLEGAGSSVRSIPDRRAGGDPRRPLHPEADGRGFAIGGHGPKAGQEPGGAQNANRRVTSLRHPPEAACAPSRS